VNEESGEPPDSAREPPIVFGVEFAGIGVGALERVRRAACHQSVTLVTRL
jgi:hypothetical protein